MSCNCIEHPGTARHRRRGTAEVELLLLVPVLLTILLLCVVASRLGRARATNVRDGEQKAYAQVVRGEAINTSAALQTVPGVVSVYGDLPTRFDESAPSQAVAMSEGWVKLDGVTLHDKGAFLDPTWHFAAYPMNGERAWVNDAGRMQQWFEGYVEDGRGQDASLIQFGLGLAAPWHP